MQNRIASLFALDELLGGKPKTHNGNGTAKRRRKRRRTAADGTVQPTPASAKHNAFHHRHQRRKTYAQSFDAGAPIRCEHTLPHTPVEQVQVPGEATPSSGAAMSFEVGEAYTVEAFEEEDEEDQLTALPDLQAEYADVDDYASEAVRASSYEPSPREPRPASDYERKQPAAFAAQMSAVEQDLADLATRVQQPGSTLNEAAPLGDDDQASVTSRPAPVPASGHGVFDSMAKGMSYATEFRLPSVQLSQVFSVLDKQLDAETAAGPAVPTVVNGPAPEATASIPPNDILIKDLVDLPGGDPAASMALAAAAIDVRHDVQLVPQLTGFSCWAAGAAMLVGWRDKISIDPSEIARATGYWAQYASGLHPEDVTMFKAWRLTPEAAQTYTVTGFADLLKAHGPLWVASAEPGPHIRVVTGIVGDGTATGTLVYINDPWEQGMQAFRPGNRGSRYTETYQRFVEKQSELGRREITLQGIYVAHN